MPCFDYRDSGYESNDTSHTKNPSIPEAILCSLLKKITEDDGYGKIDSFIDSNIEYYLKGSGITKHQVLTWWKDHEKKDLTRKEMLRKSAIAKLTPEELEELGIEV